MFPIQIYHKILNPMLIVNMNYEYMNNAGTAGIAAAPESPNNRNEN